MSDNQVPTPLSAEVVARRLPSEAPYWKLAESHELLRAQLAAKDLRIAELTRPPEVEDWKQLVALAYQSDNEGARRIFNITSEYVRMREQVDRLLEEREAILSKLPPDSPCKHAETGVSVADDVADLVRELDMLLGKPDAVHLGAQAAVTALRQCQAIQAQLAASEAARQKADTLVSDTHNLLVSLKRERDKFEGALIASNNAAKRRGQELDALRTGLEAAANAFGAAGSIAEKLYGRVRSFIDESVPGWIRGDDGPAYPLLNLSQFCNRSGSAARALLQENPATEMPSLSGNARANADLDSALKQIYAKYGHDLGAFFRDIESQRKGFNPTEEQIQKRMKEHTYTPGPITARPVEEPTQAFRDRMDQNSKFVEQMPDWVKGSPVNARPVERPIEVGDRVRHKTRGWMDRAEGVSEKGVTISNMCVWPLDQLERVEDGKP